MHGSLGALRAADVLTLARKGLGVRTLGSETRKPFRFLLCGDPELVSRLRTTLLTGGDGPYVSFDSTSVLETVVPGRSVAGGNEARCIIFLGRGNDIEGARLDLFRPLKLPIFALTVDAQLAPKAPPAPPAAGTVAEYVVPALSRDALRNRLFPHVIDACRGVEIAVGRHLPGLREAVGAKLTRDTAMSALKIAGASAVVDHVPLLGLVLGPVASAGDMVAITGLQLNLAMQLGATYGKDPDIHRVWEMLPIVGGGLGWRAISRELAGFLPVAGIAVKAAIAYAGTIVVGEGIIFFYEHGRHMTRVEAGARYDEVKKAAMLLVRQLGRKFGGK